MKKQINKVIYWTPSKIMVATVLALAVAAIVLTAVFWRSRPKISGELRVYNWESYLSPEAVYDFEKEYGVKVSIDYYKDEYIMLEEFKNNPQDGKYDLAIASDAIMGVLIRNGLISPIDGKNIPNLKNIREEFIENKFNANGLYGVPYDWGTTGLMINIKYIPADTDSWSLLWDAKHKGHLCALNNPDEVVGMAAKFLGLPLVPQSMEQMSAVRESLFLQKGAIENYCDPEELKDGLVSEKLWAAHMYSSYGRQAMEENPNLKYIIPKEGGSKWYDNFIIPKSAKNKRAAEAFIDYLNRPEVNARNADYLKLSSCNREAEKFINKEILSDETAYPSKQTMRRVEFFSDFIVDDNVEKMRGEVWEELNK